MLFNWFKKKDKLVPLEPAASGQPAGEKTKPGRHFTPGLHGKPLGRPAMAGAKKPAQATKDAAKTNTSESVVIRIGKLGEVLLQYDMISRENLEKALALQQQSFVPSGTQDKAVQKRKLLGEILIENNFVTEDQLLSAFARHCRIPYIKLNKYGLPKEAIKSVPEDLILKHKVMPVDKIGSMLMLAVTDPYDTNAVEEVAAKTGLKVKSILCKQSEFAEMVKFYYPHITEPQPQLPAGINSVPLVPTNVGDNFGNEKSGEMPADITPDITPKDTMPNIPASEDSSVETSGGNPTTPQDTERLGEETAVFKIEELPFPEPPAAQPIPVNRPIEDKAIHQEQAEPLPDQPPTETALENIQEIPASQVIPATEENHAIPTDRQIAATGIAEKQPEAPPEDIPTRLNNSIKQVEQANPEPVNNIQTAKATLVPGGTIEETAPKISPPSLQAQEAVRDESEIPDQETPVASLATNGTNGYDTSLIDIQDLITSQEITSDENIEIILEESKSSAPQDEPIDVAPYIYPDSNAPVCQPAGTTEPSSVEVPINKSLAATTEEPKEIPEPSAKIPPEQQQNPAPNGTENTQPAQTDAHSGGKVEKDKEPVRPAEEKPQPAPISALLPESGKSKDKTFEENPILVSDDEFLVARQLFTTQLAHSWEKLYHRGKPSHAEKMDESEFIFYTESAIH